MNKPALALGALISGAASLAVVGGEASVVQPTMPEKGPGDWCETLQTFGTLYSNKENPWVQKVKIFGRYHQQWTYTDGDDGGEKFSGYNQELRRLRFGASIEFLDRWRLFGRINLEDGNVNSNSVTHEDFDEWTIRYRFDDIGLLQAPTLAYGLTKVNFGGEWYVSSKEIKTVERSNLSNTYSPLRATGSIMNTKVKNVDLTFGFYSTREQGYAAGDWDGGQAYFGRYKTELAGGVFRADYLYVDATEEEDEVFFFNWAASVTYDKDINNWHLFANGTYGSRDDGDIYGVVIMPSSFIIEDRLEAVFRYQWAHATSDIIRPGSGSHTSVRSQARVDGVDIEPGNDNHSFYAGLNYYFCGNNLKVMTGFEYETLDGEETDAEATTLWGAVRFFF